ncbi:hypothetical protein ACTMU2_36460 [Cupriavidus basilensis]
MVWDATEATRRPYADGFTRSRLDARAIVIVSDCPEPRSQT